MTVRAVARNDTRQISLDFKLYQPTMTSTGVCFHACSISNAFFKHRQNVLFRLYRVQRQQQRRLS